MENSLSSTAVSCVFLYKTQGLKEALNTTEKPWRRGHTHTHQGT